MFKRKLIDVDYIVFMVGQKCSLKCKHCMHMIPYGEQKSYDAKEIIEDLKAVEKVCNIKYLQIQGGEPFTHPDIAYIINEVGKMKIGGVEIPTNATIHLKDDVIKALKDNPHLKVRISHYKCAEKQREKFIKQLEENGIDYIMYDFMFKDETWYFTGALDEKIERDDDKLKEIWNWCLGICEADIKTTMADGVLMRCAKIPIIREVYNFHDKQDYEEVEIRSLRKSIFGLSRIARGIKKYIKHKDEYREACRCCAIYEEHVPGGIQMTNEEYEEMKAKKELMKQGK